MKILNLYAGIGGNRKLWPKEHEITAVEINPEIAKIYQDNFPDDKVIVADAHKYLLEHYKEFDFIWSSPPCPTHSRMRFLLEEQLKDTPYPDMKLYEEIIFLKYWFKGKWVVENVKSYYEPLIKPFESGNHYFWSNFNINNRKPINRNIRGRGKIVNKWGFDLNKYSNKKIDMNRILNNLVNPKLALHIFNCAFKDKQHTLNGLSNTGGVLLYETETQ